MKETKECPLDYKGEKQEDRVSFPNIPGECANDGHENEVFTPWWLGMVCLRDHVSFDSPRSHQDEVRYTRVVLGDRL